MVGGHNESHTAFPIQDVLCNIQSNNGSVEMNFWEGLVLGLIVTFGVLFLSRKLAPKKTYFDMHKDEKKSAPNYKGRK